LAKKKEEAAPSIDPVDSLLKEIEKQYGKVVQTGEMVRDQKKQVIPITPSLDVELGGGVPEGSWVISSGPEKTGKTCAALTFAANAQKPEYGRRNVHFLGIEGRLKSRDVQGIEGLRLDGQFFLYQSTKEKLLSAQNYLTIAEKAIKTDPGCVVIFDSASALCDEAELNEGIGYQNRGGANKLVAGFCRQMANVVPVMGSVVWLVMHVQKEQGPFGGWTESGSKKALYQADVKIRCLFSRAWKVDDKQVGQQVNWLIESSAIGPPGGKVESWLRYGIGYDRAYELLQLGEQLGLIAKSGAYYTLTYMSGHLDLLGVPEWSDEVAKSVRAQGGEAVYQMLREHPAWVDALAKDVAAMVGA
jgi:recombination protein RecA